MECRVWTFLGLGTGALVGSLVLGAPSPAGACKCGVETELGTLELVSADRLAGTDDVALELAKWPTEAFLRGDDPEGQVNDALAMSDGTTTLLTATREVP